MKTYDAICVIKSQPKTCDVFDPVKLKFQDVSQHVWLICIPNNTTGTNLARNPASATQKSELNFNNYFIPDLPNLGRAPDFLKITQCVPGITGSLLSQFPLTSKITFLIIQQINQVLWVDLDLWSIVFLMVNVCYLGHILNLPKQSRYTLSLAFPSLTNYESLLSTAEKTSYHNLLSHIIRKKQPDHVSVYLRIFWYKLYLIIFILLIFLFLYDLCLTSSPTYRTLFSWKIFTQYLFFISKMDFMSNIF